MALSVNVTVNMPMEMVDDVTEQADEHGMSRAEYIHFLVCQADDSPSAVPEQSLTTAGVESKKDCVMILINETPQRLPAETTRTLVRSVWSALPSRNL